MSSLLLMLGMAVLSAIVIALVGNLSKTLVVQDIGSAFVAALAMELIAWILPLGMVFQLFAPSLAGAGAPGDPFPFQGMLLLYAVSFVVNLILFFIVALLTPGIEVRGVTGVIVAAAALTALDAATPYLVMASG